MVSFPSMWSHFLKEAKVSVCRGLRPVSRRLSSLAVEFRRTGTTHRFDRQSCLYTWGQVRAMAVQPGLVEIDRLYLVISPLASWVWGVRWRWIFLVLRNPPTPPSTQLSHPCILHTSKMQGYAPSISCPLPLRGGLLGLHGGCGARVLNFSHQIWRIKLLTQHLWQIRIQMTNMKMLIMTGGLSSSQWMMTDHSSSSSSSRLY